MYVLTVHVCGERIIRMAVEQTSSIVYWKPVGCPFRKEPETPREMEVNAVRQYLEDGTSCCPKALLAHFDPNLAVAESNPLLCCVVDALLNNKSIVNLVMRLGRSYSFIGCKRTTMQYFVRDCFEVSLQVPVQP